MRRALLAVPLALLAACSQSGSRSTSVAPSTQQSAATQTQQMSAHGTAGWVGQEFAGRTTANGEIFDPMLMTAAHRTLPFGTLLDVHNPKTGQTVRVRINDRGPYVVGRELDVSYEVARRLGFDQSGLAKVRLELLEVPSRPATERRD